MNGLTQHMVTVRNKFLDLFLSPSHPLRSLLLISGLFGFVWGALFNASWQCAVEGAQVLAGLVKYPANNPFYIYQVKVWTLLHQLPALGLWLGMSKKALSILLSGIMGLLGFQALALSVYVFCRNLWTSLLGALLIYATSSYSYGVNYSIFLFGYGTYGVLGRSFLFVAIALLGANQIRSGALMLGLAVAIHPSLGVLGSCTVLAAIVMEWKRNEPLRKKFLIFYLAGTAVSLMSYAVHQHWLREIPPVDPALAKHYLVPLVENWDFHRQPISFRSPGVIINITAFLISIVWLKAFRSDLPAGAALMIRVYQVAAFLSLAFSVLSRLPPQSFPVWYLMLMTPRLLNITIFGFPGLLIGLWFLHRKNVLALAILPWAVLLQGERIMVMAFFLLAGFSLVRLMRMSNTAAGPKPIPWVFRAVVILLLSAGILKVGAMKIQLIGDISVDWAHWRNDPFYRKVFEGQGMLLLSSDLGMQQLLTRRSVLIDPTTLDGLAYAPEAAPETFRIMKEIYGIDLFEIPKIDYGTGFMDHAMLAQRWMARDVDAWKKIRSEFAVTQVLTSKGVVLQLPLAASNSRYRLYDIPE